jgi:hypothetical protein
MLKDVSGRWWIRSAQHARCGALIRSQYLPVNVLSAGERRGLQSAFLTFHEALISQGIDESGF